ncbi:MAG: hypothetical protein N3B21_04155 [Clostridia bacterium]|nr:hypothetical protein [Clostridia bacterium]
MEFLMYIIFYGAIPLLLLYFLVKAAVKSALRNMSHEIQDSIKQIIKSEINDCVKNEVRKSIIDVMHNEAKDTFKEAYKAAVKELELENEYNKRVKG